MRWLFLAVALVCLSAQSQEPQKSVPPISGQAKVSDKKQEPAAPKQEITIIPPPGINVNTGGKLGVISENQQTRAYDEPSKWADPITWFTFALVIANIFLWLATNSYAKTSRNSVDLARETARRQLRAYVGIVGNEIHVSTDGGMLAYIDYANKGQTPAHDLTLCINEGVFPKDVTDETVCFLPASDEGKGGVMVPGAQWRRHCPIPLNNLDWSDIEHERETVWVWGRIDYTDAFGERCWVTFRFWMGSRRFRTVGPDGIPRNPYWPLIDDVSGHKAQYGDKANS